MQPGSTVLLLRFGRHFLSMSLTAMDSEKQSNSVTMISLNAFAGVQLRRQKLTHCHTDDDNLVT